MRWPSCAPVRSLTGGGNEHGDKRHLACPHSRACELGMKKAKALQLNPGQIITFGDHPYTAHCTRVWQGEGTSRHSPRRHQSQGHRREALARVGGIRASVRRQRGPLGAVPSHFPVTGQHFPEHAATLQERTNQRIDNQGIATRAPGRKPLRLSSASTALHTF